MAQPRIRKYSTGRGEFAGECVSPTSTAATRTAAELETKRNADCSRV